MALFAGICWGIWKGRCNYVFEGHEMDACSCVAAAMRLVREFEEATTRKARRESSSMKVEISKSWRKPAEGVVKVNIDAGFKSSLKLAAVGVVCRKDSDCFVGGLGKKVSAASPFMAESLALLLALEVVSRKDRRKVVFETDKELYSLMSRKDLVGGEWNCANILHKCWDYLSHSCNWELALVNRKGNQCVTEAMRGMVLVGWLFKPPSSLVAVLLLDLQMAHVGSASDVGDRTSIG
ncbi:uncharacterized protein LOC114760554 [Neltuma alba]|uniref:uncharacterized protein LOC114760554 n=1 Tax=Neltuma alba TaxID=207710 RepID=UPI0010A318ED|nr:uncharacterized protein LOC114760554 [Prosopis alba]